MDENLKSLASRIRGSVKVTGESPQEYFNYIYPKIFTKNREYFSNFSSEELLKIVLYVYSLKTTGDFTKAEEIFENMAFILAFSTDDEEVTVSCNNCGGEGRQDCNECGGTGNESCQECEGEGNVTCGECGGKGKVLDDEGNYEPCDYCDNGEVECDECGGDGRLDCSECDGTGRVYCDYCDGDGEITSEDENYVYVFHIISWNTFLNNRAELVNHTKESLVPNIETLHEMNDVVVLTPTETLSIEISEDYLDYEVYVYSYTDSPKIIGNQSFKIKFELDFSKTNFESFVYM